MSPLPILGPASSTAIVHLADREAPTVVPSTRRRVGAPHTDRRSEDEVKLVVLEVVPFGGVSEYRPLTLTIDADTVQSSLIDDLKRILADFPGKVPVTLHMVADGRLTRLRVGDGLRVDPVAGLYAELKALLGESSVQAGA